MIFLDSSFLVSVEVVTDQNHNRAVEIMDEIIRGEFGEAVTSDYIFDETITVTFARTKDLGKTALVGEVLLNSSRMLKVEDPVFKESWEVFKTQKSAKFSFTDCTTVSLMKEHKIENIATFDKDFKKIKRIKVIS